MLIVASLAGEEAVSLLAAGHYFQGFKLCTYELNPGDKISLANLLLHAIQRYSSWDYAMVAALPDEPFVEASANGSPRTNDEYWQIEVRPLQRWSEGDTVTIQLFVEIFDGNHIIGTVIEYSSAGEVFAGHDLVEYLNGVAIPFPPTP